MSIWAMADLHLSFGTDKPMDDFSGWNGYIEKISSFWKNNVQFNDTVIIPGDFSWGLNFDESKEDFLFIDKLPGTKIIIKGNHDYWWNTKNKVNKFFEDNNISTVKILQNDAYLVENTAICGTRGWVFMPNETHDLKISKREALRLDFSLRYAEDNFPNCEKIVFLHYPPVYANEMVPNIFDVLRKYSIKSVYYGHLHGNSRSLATEGKYNDINFKLISADHLNFKLYKIK